MTTWALCKHCACEYSSKPLFSRRASKSLLLLELPKFPQVQQSSSFIKYAASMSSKLQNCWRLWAFMALGYHGQPCHRCLHSAMLEMWPGTDSTKAGGAAAEIHKDICVCRCIPLCRMKENELGTIWVFFNPGLKAMGSTTPWHYCYFKVIVGWKFVSL